MPCSQVQLARVVVCVLVLVDVVCVMIVVLIAHVDVVHAVDTVFVAIFHSWRCTLYKLLTNSRSSSDLDWRTVIVVLSQQKGPVNFIRDTIIFISNNKVLTFASCFKYKSG